MTYKTPLHARHLEAGAKMVDFAGWEMPIHYGSQIQEHHQVRRDAGMFDVSHMTILDLRGERPIDFLRRLLANDVARLTEPGKALYSCMLNAEGGVIDDLIVYYMDERWFRMVVNAATRDKDLAWIGRQAESFGIAVEERTDLAMIAVQGPRARERAHAALPGEVAAAAQGLRPFCGLERGGLFVARTGYTGEDGYEIMVAAEQASDLWGRLLEAGVAPIGLGARDTLRLEAGMNLYGADMDETTTPLESGLGWTVAWEPGERDFIGRAALEQQRAQGVGRRLVGLVLEGKGVLRGHQTVHGGGEGEVTSGGFSPTLGRSIAFARVPAAVSPGDRVTVEIRNREVPARVVRPPFVRHGKSCLPEDLG